MRTELNMNYTLKCLHTRKEDGAQLVCAPPFQLYQYATLSPVLTSFPFIFHVSWRQYGNNMFCFS